MRICQKEMKIFNVNERLRATTQEVQVSPFPTKMSDNRAE